jgi:prevent-host-death family protein
LTKQQNIDNDIDTDFFGGSMPLVKESTDFKNSYSDLSDFCHKYQEPVIITRNGENDIAAMSIKTYEEITGIRKLVDLLEEADNDVENGNFLTEEEMDREMDLM